MLKPPMPNVAGMTDTLEFIKNLWGGMNIPGVTVPGMAGNALSTEELDKKIADLKAVEAWLNLNLGMLRGTIQAMEVQRGTIVALRSMGESMAQAMGQTAKGDAAAASSNFFSQAAQAATTPASAPPPADIPPPQAAAPADNGAPGTAAALAWWNLLQEQFRQALTSAKPAEGADKPGGSPLDVSGAAPEGSKPGGAAADAASPGNSTPGRGSRSPRGKADKT